MSKASIETDFRDYGYKNEIENYKERLISNFQEIANSADGDISLITIGQVINLIKVTD